MAGNTNKRKRLGIIPPFKSSLKPIGEYTGNSKQIELSYPVDKRRNTGREGSQLQGEKISKAGE